MCGTTNIQRIADAVERMEKERLYK